MAGRAPIVVNGRTWGLACVGSPRSQPLPPDTEARIGEFADLVATAIAATTTRAALEASLDRISVLAEHEAAFRRLATLVARERALAEVFAGVADEMTRCVRVENAAVLRYEADGAATIVGGRDDPQTAAAVAERYSPEVDHVAAVVLATGQPARIDNHNRHAVGAPIVVDGRVWGRRCLRGLTAVAAHHRGPHRSLRGSGRHRDPQHCRARRTERLTQAGRHGRR